MTVFLEQLTSPNALGLQAEAKLELEKMKTQLEVI
jgi:hypothetical protein